LLITFSKKTNFTIEKHVLQHIFVVSINLIRRNMQKNKKEDYRIRDARIQKYLLNEYFNKDIEKFYKETASKFEVKKEFIYYQVKVLEEDDFIKASSSKRGAPVITYLTDKGKTLKDELVEKAEKVVKKEEKVVEKEELKEKRASRKHKLNGFKIFKYYREIIIGIAYPIIDILTKSISGKGVLDILF